MATRAVISPAMAKLGVTVAGVVLAAISGVLDGVDFQSLVSGGWEAWARLFSVLGVAVGGALFGWARTWLHDYRPEDLNQQVEGLLEAISKANERAIRTPVQSPVPTDAEIDAAFPEGS